VETEDGVKISTNTVFAVKGEGRSSELYVDEDVKLPALQHVNLAPGGEGLMVNEKRLIKVNAEFEEEDEMAAMFCGKFSEMITGIGETEENETAGPGRSLYVKDLFALEGDYDGAWRNHFAPVLVADDTDRGTLETAVGIDLIWYGIYGKERGQSFRYKTIVADVMLQLSRSRIEPRQAEEILGYLKGYVAKGVPPEGSVPMDVGREILDIEKRLQSAAVLGDKQARPTELPSVKEKREKAEAAVREKAQDQLVLDIREGTDGWQDRVQQSHKFTLKLKIVQALESSGLEGEERGRLEAARKMVAQPQSLGSGPVEEARPWPSLLQIIGGVATLAVLGGLWYWRFHR
jgi:hypothetical protein